MRINYNVSAAIANKHLLGIEGNLSQSMERLSSGLKINHAKDNPAGMAISNKMQAQINGLNRASQNASDGISVIQISDGALNEVTSILQRMRELSVQAANDATMSLEDKKAIQDEIDSLKDEVNRISTDTEYNTKTLLDGSLDTRVYTDHASRVQISDQVEAGTYGITVEKAATQAQVEAGVDFNSTNAIGAEGLISINGSKVEISATDTYAEAYEKIRNAAEIGEVKAERDNTGKVTFTSIGYGADCSVRLEFDNKDLADAIGLVAANGYDLVEVVEEVDDTEKKTWVYGKADPNIANNILAPTGTDIEFAKDAAGNLELDGFNSSATVTTEGNRVFITDIGGVSMSFLVDAGYENGATKTDAQGNVVETYTGKLEFEVSEIGTMTLHIGANQDQNMEVRIPEVSCESLFIDDLDVTTVNGADRAMTRLDAAIAQVSDVRARLGAYENRLEYSTKSLDAFEENMTDAISRLTDVDMAEEMTNYTHQNVLNQAAISVLTQANDLPQQVLQILQ